ncbi:hypothetical protein QBC39DRAFT_371702 [Podospora conica]|nr:hypothetical protein QBC39DRAFT_371702 [Schizothecium conicum]
MANLLPDRTGQGIELSSRQSEDPGLQVYTPSTPYAPHPEDTKTQNLPWEKTAYTHHQHHQHGYTTPPLASAANFYDNRPLIPGAVPLPPKPPADDEPRILGLKRRLFFILVAVIVIVLVIGIATGVGVGVAMNGQDSPPPPPTNTTTPPPEQQQPTRLLPFPLATATTSPSDLIQCPGANLTLYHSKADLSRKFLVFCGRDYHSSAGAHDLLSKDAETMAQCIDYCAGVKECVGAGWGYQQGRYVCWLKSRLGEARVAGAWCFGVEDLEG